VAPAAKGHTPKWVEHKCLAFLCSLVETTLELKGVGGVSGFLSKRNISFEFTRLSVRARPGYLVPVGTIHTVKVTAPTRFVTKLKL
jgi:hypothetical protein